jgi:hypothetical protein
MGKSAGWEGIPDYSSIGAHSSWAVTTDRRARTAKARSASPVDIEWHAQRLDPPPKTEEERKQRAESARKAYFARLAKKGRATRTKQAQERKAQAEARTRQEYETLLAETQDSEKRERKTE